MQSISVILFLVICSTGYLSVNAQVPFLLGCPAVSVKQPFIALNFLGLWYEQQKYPIIFELGGKCVTANYSSGGLNGTIDVVNRQLNIL